MKFSVNHNRILEALRILDHFTSKKQTLPILSCVLFKTDNGRLRISATNLEMGCHVWIPAKIEEEGEIAVPSKVISSLIGAVQLEKISFTVENKILKISSDKHQTQILCMESSDFPIIPSATNSSAFEMPAGQLRDGISSVTDSLALSEVRPELNGVYVYTKNSDLVFASTDSFRLSERVVPLPKVSELSVIIPRFAVLELMKVLDIIDDNVSVFVYDNQLFVQSPNIQFVSRIVEGKFPDYSRIIPDNFQAEVRVSTKDLDKEVRLASIFCSDLNDIDMQLEDGKLTLLAKNDSRGEISSSINTESQNGDFKISLNYQYLIDGLKNMKTDFVTLKFGGQYLPFLISPDKGHNYIYLIMPLRK